VAGQNRYILLAFIGEKKGKFKQDVLLPAANATLNDGSKLLSDADLATVRTGACLSITMFWLQQIVKDRNYFEYGNMPNNENGKLVKLAAIAGQKQASLKRDMSNSSAHEIRLSLASLLGVPLEEKRCIRDTTFDNAVAAFSRLPVGQGGLVSSCVYRESTAGYIGKHATGFFINRQAHVLFFDPNVGEYEIHVDKLSLFFAEYKCVLNQSLDQSFRETDLYMAELKPQK
jgi:hypothetical protein